MDRTSIPQQWRISDDFWLLMPGTQRPMRITPSQKLLGDASTGDIATLSWSEDYEGRVVGEERCELVESDVAEEHRQVMIDAAPFSKVARLGDVVPDDDRAFACK